MSVSICIMIEIVENRNASLPSPPETERILFQAEVRIPPQEEDMTFIYPAVFTPKEDGSYTARFPDLEGCTAKGITLDDCVDDAIEAARTWLQVELEEDDWDLPAVSSPEDIDLLPGEEVRSIGVKIRLYEGWDE